jgi:hypothetical protein
MFDLQVSFHLYFALILGRKRSLICRGEKTQYPLNITLVGTRVTRSYMRYGGDRPP